MRIKLIAASVVALAMATSVSYAQSNPVPNHMATDKNANEDAGGGAGSSDSSGTKTMKPMGTDSTMTNSTTCAKAAMQELKSNMKISSFLVTDAL